jgi:O-succinylhomoserine sulfhydrylase
LILIIDNCFNPLFAATYEMGCALGSTLYKVNGRTRRVLGGITVGDPELIQKSICFLDLRGSLSRLMLGVIKSLETLAIRLDRHCENALKVAEFWNSIQM